MRLLYDCKARKVHFRNVSFKKSSCKFLIADNVIMKGDEMLNLLTGSGHEEVNSNFDLNILKQLLITSDYKTHSQLELVNNCLDMFSCL